MDRLCVDFITILADGLPKRQREFGAEGHTGWGRKPAHLSRQTLIPSPTECLAIPGVRGGVRVFKPRRGGARCFSVGQPRVVAPTERRGVADREYFTYLLDGLLGLT